MSLDPRTQFGPVAEKYLHSASHAHAAELSAVVEVARPAGGLVLDVATGAGHTALAMAPYAERVVALDPTREMLEVARAEAEQRELGNVDPVMAWAEELPFRTASFDGVTCRIAAHHFRSVPRFLAEARRCLKAGGWLVIVDTIGIDDPIADEELDRIEFLRDPSHARNLTVEAWRQAVVSAGFRVDSTETWARPHNVVGWLDRMKVQEPTRSNIIQMVVGSEGWLRDYLRPHGEGDALTFHLHQVLLRATAL